MSKAVDTNRELNIFESFDKHCRIIKECDLDGKKYVELRTKFSSESCLEDTTTWIKQYSMTTKTNWIVQRTYKDPQRYLFRKDFVCQHSSKNKISHQYFTQRNKGCTVKICIWVRMETANTRRIDKLMRIGLNTTIKITGSHSHELNDTEAFSSLRVNDKTENLFISYFEKGLGPAESKTYHENTLIVGHNEKDVPKVLSNGQINPSDRHIHYIYDNWRKKHHRDEVIQSTIASVVKNKELYEEKGAIVSVQENPMTVSILTPVMQRAHTYEFANETVFVVSTSTCNESATITFFIAGSNIGGIPLGCVIHSGQTEEDYCHAFNAMKTVIGPSGFGGKSEPKVFLTDDSTPKKKALSKIFKSSKLSLSPFDVYRVVWSWLWAEENGISQCDRKYLMLIVRQIMFKMDVADCNEQIARAFKCPLVKKYPRFKKYLLALQSRKSEWCVAYRPDCITRSRDVSGMIEASIRVFKDIFLRRCKEFNPVALTEFVVNILETHYTRRLQTFASYRVTSPDMEFKKFCTQANDLKVENVDYSLFHITSTINEDVVHTVHSDLTVCECADGIAGKFCKHLCAVHVKHGAQISWFPMLSFEDKIMFARIAFGNDVDETFFKKMASAEVADESASTSAEVTDILVPMVQIKEIDADEFVIDDDDDSLQDCLQTDAEEDVKEIDRLSNNLDTLVNLVKANYNSCMDKTLRKFNDSLENIQTPSQIMDFLETYSSSYAQHSGKKMKILPNSISRRTSMYKGSIPSKVGRPINVDK